MPAARLAIAAGRLDEARKIAAELGQRLSAQSRAYGEADRGGNRDRPRKQYVEALDALNAAQKHRGPVARPLRAGPRLLQSWRLSRGRLGIREVPRAARRGDGGVPRRPADRSLLRDPALLARARARDAEARRAARSSRSSCGSARAPPAIRSSRTRGAGSNPPRANLSLGSPPAPNDWRAVRFRRYRHRHRPGGSRDDSRDGRDDGRDSGGERIEFDAASSPPSPETAMTRRRW